MIRRVVPLFLSAVVALPILSAETYGEWRDAIWSGTDRETDSISGIASDPDGDGLVNGLEYKLGTNPLKVESTSPLTLSVGKGEYGVENALRVAFSELADRDSLRVRVENANTLGGESSWNDGNSQISTIARDSGTVRKSAFANVKEGKAFMRLGVDAESSDFSYLWWEAEDFATSSDAAIEEHEVLSGGKWLVLNDVDSGVSRFIEYEDITVPSSGEYYLYARKFWKHGPYHWSMDGNEEQFSVDRDVALIDGSDLRLHTGANWTLAGKVFLEEGAHVLRIELDEAKGAAAFDCFVLTQRSFPFRGKYRPDQVIEGEEPGWFAWTAEVDPHEYSPIDLSFLNETYAGSRGFIRAEGEDFVYPDTGDVVRFWGTNAGVDVKGMDGLSATIYARHLAKMGVNLVRAHGSVYAGTGVSFEAFSENRLDRLHQFVAALKEEGIYVSLSIYFPLWVRIDGQDDRFSGYPTEGGNEHPFGVLFYDERFQDLYQDWWDRLVTPVNPYTGMSLKDDPAVLSLEILNEDSLMFWTFSQRNIPDTSMRLLEAKFAEWLVDRYVDLESVSTKWGGFGEERDDPDGGRIAFLDIGRVAWGSDQRAKDTARFLTEVQKSFFEDQYAYLKEDLGYPGMVYGSNWITANDVTLGPLDKYSNTVGDYMDRHGYYDVFHEHQGDWASSYAVRVGHLFRNNSALKFLSRIGDGEYSFANPVMNIVYDDKPSSISEVNWPMPNRYRADMPFLMSTFGRMQGLDMVVNFTSTAMPWELETSKFPMQTPVMQAQWAAAALVFRNGYVEEGDVVAETTLPLENHLYELKGSPLALAPSLDNLRDPGEQSSGTGSVHPLSFLTGRSKIHFRPDGDFSEQIDVGSLVDLEERTIVSSTGELRWNYGQGFATANALRFQGVTGFLADAGSVSLSDVEFVSPLEYGSMWLVSLDEKPISVSDKMLLLVMSEEKTSGWRTGFHESIVIGEGANQNEYRNVYEIEDLGGAPFMVKEIEGTVSLLRSDADLLRVSTLDQNGYWKSDYGTARTIQLLPDVVYYLIEKPSE